jgi:alpha-D-xyloside xylohydrolase
VNVYPGADGVFRLYEDDGVTFGHQRGEWMAVDMRWNDRERRLSLRLAAGSRMRPPAQRRMHVRVAGTQTTRDIVFNGTATEVRL